MRVDNMLQNNPEWLIVISAGTGGPQALAQILPHFPMDFPGSIIIVQQMRPGFTRVLADQLNHICTLPVFEPTDGQLLQSSRILVAPSGRSVTVEPLDGSETSPLMIYTENITDNPQLMSARADNIMASATKVFKKKTIGVLLTGVGRDGCEGIRAIVNAGGTSLIQDERSSVVHDLPASAIDALIAQEVLPLYNIANRITEIVTGESNAIAA